MSRVLTIAAMADCARHGHRFVRVPTWHSLGFTECGVCGQTWPSLRGPVEDALAEQARAASAMVKVAAASVAPSSREEPPAAASEAAKPGLVPPAAPTMLQRLDAALVRDCPTPGQQRRAARNAEIVRRVAAGEQRQKIAQEFGIHPTRVCQILQESAAQPQGDV